jgi:transcriptional regulator with XRE-family HTH domain
MCSALGRLLGVRSDTVVTANLIREARLRAGLTQTQLGERIGKATVQVGRWETGAVAPTVDTLLAIVRACGFDIPLMLQPYEPMDDRRLVALQRRSPEQRVQHMLARLREGEPG